MDTFWNQLDLKYMDRYWSTDSCEPVITPSKYRSQTYSESSLPSVVWPGMAHCLYPTRSFFTENSAKQITYEVSCPLNNWYKLLLCG